MNKTDGPKERTGNKTRLNGSEKKSAAGNLGSLESKATQLAPIAELSPDAIILNRLDGAIVYWNRGAENIYGYSRSEANCLNVSVLAPPEEKDAMSNMIKRINPETGQIMSTRSSRKERGSFSTPTSPCPLSKTMKACSWER